MKHPASILRCLLACALSFATACALVAQTTTATTSTKSATPTAPSVPSLELPRLKSKGPAELPRLAKSKVSIDDLSPQGAAGARSLTKQNINYLALDPGKAWSRPLRGSPNDTTFVSFLVYGSETTVIDVGGALLTVRLSGKTGYAQLTVGGPTDAGRPTPAFSDLIKIETHDGANLAALPVFTVRLDPKAGVWDLYAFQRLVAEDLPLAAANGARKFSVTAGSQGAWILNLVASDENPLFVDANTNGIDDAFEKSQPGGVLPANAPAAQRTQVAQAWKDRQNASNVQPWRVRRPVPDVVAATQPK